MRKGGAQRKVKYNETQNLACLFGCFVVAIATEKGRMSVRLYVCMYIGMFSNIQLTSRRQRVLHLSQNAHIHMVVLLIDPLVCLSVCLVYSLLHLPKFSVWSRELLFLFLSLYWLFM